MNNTRRTFWSLLAALAIAGTLYLGAGALESNRSALAQSARPTVQPKDATVASAGELSRAFRAVHDSLKDSVVHINVTRRPRTGTVRLTIPEEFRGMLPPGFDEQLRDQMENRLVAGSGSGVIVSSDGHVLTNNHVVSEADEVKVILSDGRELTAEVVGTDPKTDLAVIRIRAEKLTFARLGDSDALQVGDWVLAFGSPFGLSQTMTQGIVSAKGRHVPIIAANDPSLRGMTYENFLQTDAAINPGNSGGPLANLRGEVVGINAAIASSTGAYNGVGFSIPSNDAKYIMNSLIAHGKVVRGYLGVGIQDLKDVPAEQKGLVDAIRKSGFTGETGILVGQVSSDGPASKAGLEAGDVITKVDGKEVQSTDALRNEIARTAPDTDLRLTVFREGKTQDIVVKVGTQPESLRPVTQAVGRPRDPGAANATDIGLRVQDVNAAVARRFNLAPGRGVLVTAVTPGSAAARAGLEPGEVITRVDRTDVASSRELMDAINRVPAGEGLRLVVRTEEGMDRLVYLEKN